MVFGCSTVLYMALESSITKEMIRMCLLYDFKSRVNAAESSRRICAAFGTDTVSKSTAQTWFKRFLDGDTSTENQLHSRQMFRVHKK